MHKKIIGIVLGAALLSPALTLAQTSDLQTLIATLNQQVTALQAKIQAAQSNSSDTSGSTSTVTATAVASSGSSMPAWAPCLSITHSLGVDDTDADNGGDVSRLQQFLAQDSSIYPEGRVTGYFGPATMRAVQRWQARNGIVSSGDPDSTGYGFVGPKTRAAMMRSCGGGGGGDNDFSATPTSGSAPLTVTFTVSTQFTGGTLNYGDGSSDQVPGWGCGDCGINWQRPLTVTLTHTYSSNGTYRATVSRIWPADDQMVTTNCQGDCGTIQKAANTVVQGGPIKMITIVVGGATTNDYGFQVSVSGNTARFTMSPQNGHQAQDFIVDFGDGSHGQLSDEGYCTNNGLGVCQDVWAVSHTYGGSGTFTAGLYPYIACLYANPRCEIAQSGPLASLTVNIGTTATILTASPASGTAPLTVTFTYPISTVPGVTRYIDFGDQQTSQNSQQTSNAAQSCYLTCNTTRTHTYAQSGTYTAKLIQITDPCATRIDGVSCTQVVRVETIGAVTVTVTGMSDSSFHAAPQTGSAPLTVNFWGPAPDMGSTFPAGFYRVDFGDGTSGTPSIGCGGDPRSGTNACPRALVIQHAYQTAGTYTATLTSNNCPPGAQCLVGPTTMGTVTITVSGTSAKESLSASPSSGVAPLDVTFSANSLSTALSYFIDFGDGSTSQSLTLIAPPCAYGIDCSHSFQARATHTYAKAGNYTATLSQSGLPLCFSCKAPALATASVNVSSTSNAPTLTIGSPSDGLTVPQKGVLRLSWSTQNAPTNSSVAFWLQDTNGGGYGRIAVQQSLTGTYDWTVPGDNCNPDGSCFGMSDNPNVWYTKPGTYNVIGKVYTPADANLGGGLLAPSPNLTYLATAKSGTFTITAPQSSGAPSISGLDAPTSLNVGQSGTWTVRASAPSGGQLSYNVVWGDEKYVGGSTASSQAMVNVAGTFTHAYQTAGTYTPVFTVSNSVGSAQTSATVTVGGPLDIGCTANYPICGAGYHIGGVCNNQCIPDSTPTIPTSVLQRADQLMPVYGSSIGVFVSRCVRSDINDTVFTVTGSGGFSGITYYYNAGGTMVGSVSFSDTPPFVSGLAPVDTSRYQCTQIKSSRSPQGL